MKKFKLNLVGAVSILMVFSMIFSAYALILPQNTFAEEVFDPGATDWSTNLDGSGVIGDGFIPNTDNSGNIIGQGGAPISTISLLIIRLQNIINLILPFLVGLAVFVIIYGILGYISSAADEEKRKQAKDFIIWGVIGVFCMLSIWGFVTILVNSLGLNNSNSIVTQIYAPITNAPSGPPTTVPLLIDRINAIGSIVIPFLIGIGFFIVVLGIFNYIRKAENEEARAEARQFIIWGVISIFMMLSIWGLVNILVGSFQLNNVGPNLPTLPTL